VKKAILFSLLVVLALSVSAFASGGLVGQKIYVDPGHGGTAPGAVGPTGLKESDVNLRVGTVLKNCLIEYGGATVRMSRTDDSTLSLDYRTTDANNWGASRFISVHHNASTDASVNGTETYCYYYGSTNSFDLRDKVQAQLLAWGGLTNRGAQTAGFYVIKYTSMPAILTEASFISNPAEEARLRDANYTWREGYYIYKGVCDHYGVSY
jgi:N-acetylmuramoyl-L-alanine amidase